MKVTQHLTLRVAWHDAKLAGIVCNAPSGNSFCAMLDRVREQRDDAAEDALSGKDCSILTPDQLPPCKTESCVFLNPSPWRRRIKHPYANSDKCTETHGTLRSRLLEVPPFTAIAVPFLWMLRSEQARIDASLPEPLPKDTKDPFKKPSPWVFSKERQCALSNHVFNKLDAGRSLFFPTARLGFRRPQWQSREHDRKRVSGGQTGADIAGLDVANRSAPVPLR